MFIRKESIEETDHISSFARLLTSGQTPASKAGDLQSRGQANSLG
jgi:hypothetical protein